MRPSEIAAKYLGEHEIKGVANRFTNDTEFGKKIHAVGQKDGESWCAYFCEMVFKEVYPDMFKELDRLFSANAGITYENFVSAGYVTGELPAVDWLVIYRHMKDSQPVIAGKKANGQPIYQGHAGIVSKINLTDKYLFEDISGNTGDATGREGDKVARLSHRVNPDQKDKLKVLGFIQITPSTLKPI